MNVIVDVVGEEAREVSVADDATYADVISEVGFSTHEVSALVDGTPVPEDRPVEAERVRILRLIRGG